MTVSFIFRLLTHSIVSFRRQYSLSTCSIFLCGALLFWGLGGSPAIAQEVGKPLKVATLIAPPFVSQENGQLAGFSIELWNEIANKLKVSTQYVIIPNLPALSQALKTQQVDLAISAISITSEREQFFDFSQPFFESGLQIMVSHPRRGAVLNLLKILLSNVLWQIIGIASLLALLAAHIIWLIERRGRNPMISSSYVPGIFQAIWWAALILATQPEQMPKGVLSRLFAIVWVFVGVLFVTYFTAAITASLTVQQLQGTIRGPNDLHGRVVATVKASTSARYLKEQQIDTVTFPEIHLAYEALLAGDADAIVYDAPILLYYAAHEGQGKVQMVGNPFNQEDYGIVFPTNSPYRKPVNAALLRFRETGGYQQLYETWFGVDESAG